MSHNMTHTVIANGNQTSSPVIRYFFIGMATL